MVLCLERGAVVVAGAVVKKPKKRLVSQEAAGLPKGGRSRDLSESNVSRSAFEKKSVLFEGSV